MTMRRWGLAVQAYATRSTSSWGIGDLDDLTTIAAAGRRAGAGFVLVNPLHADSPVVPRSHRRTRR